MEDTDIVWWRGRPIEELSREELVECIKILASQLRSERERHMASLEIWSMAAKRRAA